MSRKPGLGALTIPDLVDALTSDSGADLIESHGDVPIALNHGRRSLPLGRYMRRKLREQLGIDEEAVKKNRSEKKLQEMSFLRLQDEALARTPEEALELRRKRYAEKKQKIRNIESRIKARTKGGIL